MIKVLIADDDQAVRSEASHFFERRGSTVLEAATLEEAVETARREQPAVAILDSDTQSEIDGFAAVPAIKEEAPPTRVILLVAATHATRRREAQEAGADLVLDKGRTSLSSLGTAVINLLAQANA